MGGIAPQASEPLDADQIRERAGGSDIEIAILDVVGSTNDRALCLARAGAPDGTLVIANAQTAGRGRRGHTFYSPADTGLYLSYVARLSDSDGLSKVTIAAGVAACEAIDECAGVVSGVKWVNDLYVSGRKVGGVLCESVYSAAGPLPSAVVIGIGINCSTTSFPEDIAEKAGSVGVPGLSRNKLAGTLCTRLRHWLALLNDPRLMDAYRARSLILGREVAYDRGGRQRHGVAVGISDEGSLLVRDKAGHVNALVSGEVSVNGWR